MLQQKITTTLNFFYLYQLPVPYFTQNDSRFAPVLLRAARLTCTTPESDDLAQSVGLTDHHDGATASAERARLRAELDGLVVHLYGLDEEESAHILVTFPLVVGPVTAAAPQA